MASKYLVVNQAEVNKLLSGTNGAVYNEMKVKGNAVLREARRLCPKNNGTLADSLSMEFGKANGSIVVRVGTNLYYGLYVHEGTANNGTGYIYPKNFNFLRFPSINNTGSGNRRYRAGATAKYTYAKRVRGVKARPFLRDALDNVM